MSPSVDIDLTAKDLAAITSPDALAALLDKLGYPTDRRTSLEAAALGLADDSAVRKLELLSEDADQFLRVYFVQVKSVTAKIRNDIVRVLGKLNQDHLVILTKDFSQLELVLIVKVRHAKNLGEETGYKPIARTITINRSSVDRTTLRILRRLTWTASDGLAQYDKLRSVFEAAAYSGEYFQNRALFADHYLTTRLKEDNAWASSPNAAFQQIRTLLETAKPKVALQDEKAGRQYLFEPLFKTLGFTPKSNPTQPNGEPAADYDLRDGGGILRAAALVYQWDRWLDGPDDRDPLTPSENPGAAVVSLLEKGDVSWVIVTNGRHWRLYSRAAHSRSTNFYEIELEEALEAGDGIDPNEAFRYFWLFFRAEAFQATATDDKTVWLDTIVQGSRDYAREVERELKKRVFERVVPFLAKGFLADRSKRLGIKKKPDEEELETIRQGTLTLLYRILFLLYAESRDLLPIRESPYFELSLKKVEKEIAEHAGSAESVSDENLAEHYAKDDDAIYVRLAKLCATMDSGDAAVNVPTYNGGLFRTKLEKETSADRDAIIARFLHEHRVPDLYLAAAIDHLARVPDPRQGFGLAFVDYKSLGVRQLGSIYEGLLEYRLFVAEEDLVEIKEKSKIAFKPLNEIAESKRSRRDSRIVHRGDIYLANDKAERKATGSYYTPENIVEYIVAHTVRPVLQRKLDSLIPEFRKAEQTYQREFKNAQNDPRIMLGSGLTKSGTKPASEQIRAWAASRAYEAHRDLVDKLFDLKVLDPAMGSGHFLVDAVDFVTDKLLVWLNQFRPFNPVLVMLDRTRRNILDSLNIQGINIDPDRLTDVHLLKRHVLKRCIFGVDLNPLATELAKVSLWLDAFTLGAPLSFLDHHLRVGNSLIGATFDNLQMLAGGSLFAIDYEPMMRAIRNVLVVSRLSDTTAAEVHKSQTDYASARTYLDGYRLVLDLIVAKHFGLPKASQLITDASDLQLDSREHFLLSLNDKDASLVRQADSLSRDRRFFHWELEFPEVFFHYHEGSKQQIEKKKAGDAGFDCVIGNPPYDVIEKERGEDHDPHSMLSDFIRESDVLKAAAGGKLNLFRAFVVLGIGVASSGASVGMIVPLALIADISCAETRRHLLRSAETVDASCFPQKDDAARRVFPEAKLATVVLIVRKVSNTSENNRHIDLSIYPAGEFHDEPRRCRISTDEINDIDPNTAPIPLVDELQWKVMRRIYRNPKVTRFENLVEIQVTRGEINQTTFRDYISSDPSLVRMIKGSEVGRFYLRAQPGQGEREWFDENKYLRKHSPRSIARTRRIATQRITGLDEQRRIVAAIIEPPAYFADSTNSIAIDARSPYKLEYVLALLNSSLFQWRFRLTSTNNNVATNELAAMPFRRIEFDDPDDRALHDDLVKLVTELSELRSSEGKRQGGRDRHVLAGESDVLNERIEQLVTTLYALSENDRRVIQDKYREESMGAGA